MNLTSDQENLIESIVEYGEENGFSNEQIEIAVELAYIESSFGEALDNPDSTASGPFQYLDGSWETYHSALGDKNDIGNQIEAAFNDISTFTGWFTNPQTNGNIPDSLSLAEYVYIKHHDGRSYSDFENAPGLAIYNSAITSSIESDIKDEINEAKTGNDEGGSDENDDEWDDDNSGDDDGWDDDDDWGDDVETWEGSYYDEDSGDWVDFEFEGTEDEFDDWLDDEGYLDCGGSNSEDDEEEEEDPLVLDLDGDGIELLNINDSDVTFDYNQDGTQQQTSWVSADDGLLAMDNNQDGMINDIGELFGNRSEDGFSELSGLDSNGDGKISDLDDMFSELLVWQDKNSDGISQEGELNDLISMGIESIDLAAVETGETSQGDGAGYVSHTSTVTYEDGTTTTIGEAWFATEQALEQETSMIYRKVSEMSAEQAAKAELDPDLGLQIPVVDEPAYLEESVE